MNLRGPLELCVDLADSKCLLREVRSPLVLRGAHRDSSRITAGMNRASCRVEEGTSGFLSISDFDSSISAELEQESQASSCVEKWKSACLSVVHGVTGHLLKCIWNLWLFSG